MSTASVEGEGERGGLTFDDGNLEHTTELVARQVQRFKRQQHPLVRGAGGVGGVRAHGGGVARGGGLARVGGRPVARVVRAVQVQYSNSCLTVRIRCGDG